MVVVVVVFAAAVGSKWHMSSVTDSCVNISIEALARFARCTYCAFLHEREELGTTCAGVVSYVQLTCGVGKTQAGTVRKRYSTRYVSVPACAQKIITWYSRR